MKLSKLRGMIKLIESKAYEVLPSVLRNKFVHRAQSGKSPRRISSAMYVNLLIAKHLYPSY